MKIGIVGFYGKLGKSNYEIIKENGHTVSFGVSRSATLEGDDFQGIKIYKELVYSKEECEGIIDFSNRNNVKQTIDYCLKYNIPLVIGTTGLLEEDKKIIYSASKKIPILLSHNTAYGVNVLLEIVKKAYSMLPDFDIEIIEKHHSRKEDSPSGTSKMIFNSLKKVNSNIFSQYGRYGNETKRKKDEVGFHSIRGGHIISDHDVIFAKDEEVITISHRAISDKVFSSGALKALLFLKTKDKGLFEMSDVIFSKI